MKRLLAVSTAVLVALSSAVYVSAQTNEPKDGKAKCEKDKPALTDMTVTGTVTKEEKQSKKGKTFVHYVLTDSTGNTVMLPGAGKHGGRHEGTESVQSTPVNLEEYVNKDVTIVGKGRQIEREGKTITRLVEITKIDVVTANPAAK